MGVDTNQNATASDAATNAAASVPSSSSPSIRTSFDRKRKQQAADIFGRAPSGNKDNKDGARPQKIKKVEPVAPLDEKRLRRSV